MANSFFERLARIARAELKSRSSEQTFDSNDEFFNRTSATDSSSTNSQNPEIAGYYANLEIPYGSDIETVNRAWKILLRKYHPDLHSTDPEKVELANKIVQQLNKAHAALEKYLAK